MSKAEESVLRQFKILVDFLGNMLGPDYEIILHDLNTPNQSVIAIANSHISGRSVGSPLTNTALRQIKSREYEVHDYTDNYVGTVRDGRLVRSATMYIKNDAGKPIGLLCMNYDDTRMRDAQSLLQEIAHPKSWLRALAEVQSSLRGGSNNNDTSLTLETFHDNIEDLMSEIYRDVSLNINIPADHFSQQDRLDIVTQLEKRGLFKLKGSVPFVAEKLHCSQASVYRYLNQITRESLAQRD